MKEVLPEHFAIILKLHELNSDAEIGASCYVEKKIGPNSNYRINGSDNRRQLITALVEAIEEYRKGELTVMLDEGWNIDGICMACANGKCYRKSDRAEKLRNLEILTAGAGEKMEGVY